MENIIDIFYGLKKETKISFDDFLMTLQQDLRTYTYLRYGQVLMHTLYNHDRNKYKEITGTEYDCFFDNKIVSKTLDKLEKEWTT